MEPNLFSRYTKILSEVTPSEIEREVERPDRFLIANEAIGNRKISIAYAPFDFVEENAQIVIVGLTPGRQQMRNALFEASHLLKSGSSDLEALSRSKVYASFSGPMRSNLVAMLDFIGVHRLLELTSTHDLWGEASRQVHFTSALRYPTFVDGKNFSGTPDMMRTPFLAEHLDRWFGTEIEMFRTALIVPLGPKVDQAVRAVAEKRGLGFDRILSGLPHPSGANAERIAFFLKRKNKADLSNKVAPDRILAARTSLISKVSALMA